MPAVSWPRSTPATRPPRRPRRLRWPRPTSWEQRRPNRVRSFSRLLPELPEVETIRVALDPLLTGHRIERAEIYDYRLTLPEPPEAVAQQLEGERILEVDRRGKYLLLRFESGRVLLVHLRMTGSLRAGRLEDDPHRRAVLTLDDGSFVAYRDLRRFGTWLLLDADDVEPYLRVRLGADPFDRRFDLRR